MADANVLERAIETGDTAVLRDFLAGLPRKSIKPAALAAATSSLLSERLTLLWQFKGTFRGISAGYEFRIGKAKRRWHLWK